MVKKKPVTKKKTVKSPKRKPVTKKKTVKSPKRKKVKSPKKKPVTKKKTVKSPKRKRVKRNNPRGLIVGHVGKKTDDKGLEYYVYIDRDFDNEINNTLLNIKNNRDLSVPEREYMYTVIREMKSHSKKVISGIEVPVKWIELYNDSYKKLFPRMMETSYEMNKRVAALAY